MGETMKNKDNRGYEHPLSLGQPPAGGGPIRSQTQVIGMGLDPDPSWELPFQHGQHAWIGMLAFRVESESLARGALAFSPAHLAQLTVACWVCDRVLEHLEMIDGPCLGDPSGRYTPTRGEYLAWPDERRMEFWRSRVMGDGDS